MELKTVLHSTHVAMGARMVPFGGWDMPVQYAGILAEVKAVRTAAGIFDVSHMGRLYIEGPRAADFLDWALTGSASGLRVGRARYCFICNPEGGVIDDTIFYRLTEERFLLIPNAGNRDEVVAWFGQQLAGKFPEGVTLDDRTMETGLIAVQGPGAEALLDGLVGPGGNSFSSLRSYSHRRRSVAGIGVTAGRTGYTGEDGFEMVSDAGDTERLWNALVEAGATPCGLGARDVLRLEAGLPLHGHEIDQTITPIEAWLERFVRKPTPRPAMPGGYPRLVDSVPEDLDFIGQKVLQQQRVFGTGRKLVGLKLRGRSAPRAGYPVSVEGENIGSITSGSYSPTLDISIAMGYVLGRYAAEGQVVDVDIRGRTATAEIVSLPFYSRALST